MEKIQSLFFFLMVFVTSLIANPQGHQVISGQASIAHSDNLSMHITASDKAIINWDSFSIASKEMTKFIMPSSTSSVLNRVISSNPSELLGKLDANGHLFLINPNGILIGENATINAASFVASSFDVLNEDFLKNENLIFQGDSQKAIINLGKIKALDGDAVLLGYFVKNAGSISAKNGVAALGAARQILLKPYGKERIYIEPQSKDQKGDEIGIENTGQIEAIRSEIKADGNIYSIAIKDAAKIDALGIKNEKGKILLFAENGKVEVSGSYIAKNEDEVGGKIDIYGEDIHLLDKASLDVSGKIQAGKIAIGRRDANVRKINIEKEVFLRADGLEEGNAGEIIVFSKDDLSFYGSLSARGGDISGDGGFVEISSQGSWKFSPMLCDRLAPKGTDGMLYLDPVNVLIDLLSVASNPYMKDPYPDLPNPTATAILDVNDLQSALASGSVMIDATTGNAVPPYNPEGNIFFNHALSWNASNTLRVKANKNIYINAPITHMGESTKQVLDFETAINNEGNIYINDSITVNASPTVQGQSAVAFDADKDIHICAPITLTGSSYSPGDPNIHCVTRYGDIIVRSRIETHGSDLTHDIVLSAGKDVLIGEGSHLTPAYLSSITSENILIHAENCIHLRGTLSSESSADAFIQAKKCTLNAVTKDIVLEGGHSDTNSSAYIQCENLEMQAEKGNIYFKGGSKGVSEAFIKSTNTIDINAAGELVLQGGSGEKSVARAFIMNEAGNGNIHISAKSLRLIGGSAEKSDAFIQQNGGLGNIRISNIEDNITLLGGSGVNSNAFIDNSGGKNIYLGNSSVPIKGNVILKAGSGDNHTLSANACITTLFGGNIISYINGDYYINGGTSATKALAGFSAATINGQGDVILKGRNLTLLGGSGSGLNHAAIVTGGPIENAAVGGNGSIDIEMAGSLRLKGTSESNKATIAIWGEDTHNVKVVADKDIIVDDYGMIKNLSKGKTILVTDNANPGIVGSGSFILSEKGQILSDEMVFVYVSHPSRVSVASEINGSLHALPPYSTDQHRFSTFYPLTYSGGPGFVFYYKSAESGFEPNGAITYGIFLSCLLNSEIFYMLDKLRREDIFNINPYSRYIQRYRVFSLINSLDEYQDLKKKVEEKVKLEKLWVENTIDESIEKTEKPL